MHIPIDTELRTERLILRAANFPDIDLVWDASRFEGFNDGMTWDPPSSREALVQITQRNIDNWHKGSDYVFTIFSAAPLAAIGRVGLHRERIPAEWSIGFWVHPAHWGQGFAPEAAQAVLDLAFDKLKAKKVVTAHAVWDKRSEGVIRRLGFKYVRENPEGLWKRGQPVAEYEYELQRAL